jgi:hypothetical protein
MTAVLEGVGVGIGIASLIAAFKGAVDGYLLIESIFEEDTGLRDLVLDYNIERQKLTSWGDRFNVNAAREEDCLFHRERGPIKVLMAEIFGRIEYFHKQADSFLQTHGASDHRVDYNGLATAGTGFNKFLQLHSQEVISVSKNQMAKKQKARTKWAIKNKAKFEEVVRRLRKANEDLLGLLSEPSLYAFVQALPAYVLAHASSNTELQQAKNVAGSENDLIRQAARLKLLQSAGGQSHEATLIDALAVESSQALKGSVESRKMSVYDKVARVWVEWLGIERTLSPVEMGHTKDRIKTLSLMLETAPETFRVAKCIGYIQDQYSAYRMGLVYRIPTEIQSTGPISLLDIIKKHKEFRQPPLGDRFKLAMALATTLMQLHASNWLHKAFRGDNILFFSTFSALAADISAPHLSGFEYARDTKMQSIGYRPNGQGEHDYYYHPDVGNGFTKTLDLYSLGVVLLEIAFWRPLASKIPPKNAKSLESIQQLFVASADERLDAAVGSIYANVVRCCLTCAFPDPSLESEFACAMNTEVVLQLERCVA